MLNINTFTELSYFRVYRRVSHERHCQWIRCKVWCSIRCHDWESRSIPLSELLPSSILHLRPRMSFHRLFLFLPAIIRYFVMFFICWLVLVHIRFHPLLSYIPFLVRTSLWAYFWRFSFINFLNIIIICSIFCSNLW